MATTGIDISQSWAARALGVWRSMRVAAGTAIAEAAVLWVMVEALSNRSVGPVSFWPFIVAHLLISVGPLLLRRPDGLAGRLVSVLPVLAAAIVLVKGLAFPDLAWLDRDWLNGAGNSLIFRDSPAVMPVWVPILITVAARWWEQRRTDHITDDVRISFRLGTLGLVAAAVIGAFTGLESQGPVTTGATVFFAGILLAMGWARQAAVHPGELRGGTGVAAATTLAGVIAILLVATALVAITNPAAFDTLIWILSPIFWLIRNAVLGLSFLLLVILTPIFWFVSWLLSLRSNQDRPAVTPQVFEDPSPSAVVAPADGSVSLPDELRIALASVVLAILVLVIARQALRRVVAVATETDVEQHVEFDLRSLLRRRRPTPVAADSDPLSALRRDPRFGNTVAIREIYATYLRATGTAGLARRRAETARTHAQRVATALGSPLEDIHRLTADYGTVRYGEVPATDDQRLAVASAWERVAPRLASIAASPGNGGQGRGQTSRGIVTST